MGFDNGLEKTPTYALCPIILDLKGDFFKKSKCEDP
jgi:hypothetical protein